MMAFIVTIKKTEEIQIFFYFNLNKLPIFPSSYYI